MIWTERFLEILQHVEAISLQIRSPSGMMIPPYVTFSEYMKPMHSNICLACERSLKFNFSNSYSKHLKDKHNM